MRLPGTDLHRPRAWRLAATAGAVTIGVAGVASSGVGDRLLGRLPGAIELREIVPVTDIELTAPATTDPFQIDLPVDSPFDSPFDSPADSPSDSPSGGPAGGDTASADGSVDSPDSAPAPAATAAADSPDSPVASADSPDVASASVDTASADDSADDSD